MTKMQRLITLILVSVLVAGSAFYFGYKQFIDRRTDDIACSARLFTVRGDTRANLMMNFNVNPKHLTGTVSLNGIISVNDEKKEQVYRRVAFSYTKFQTYYRFSAMKIQPATDEHINDASHLDILPEFFTREGADVDWKVTEEKNQGYLFSVGKIPRFFCEL